MSKIFTTLMMAVLLAGSFSQAKKVITMQSPSNVQRLRQDNLLYCLNQPAKKWGTYFAVSGLYIKSDEIFEVQYGTYEGSQAAEEQEPVDTFEFKSLKNNPKLAATSAQWKTASSFDVSTPELGQAVLYIRQESFAGQDKEPVVRVKFSNGKDVKMPCTQFGR